MFISTNRLSNIYDEDEAFNGDSDNDDDIPDNDVDYFYCGFDDDADDTFPLISLLVHLLEEKEKEKETDEDGEEQKEEKND